MMGIKVETVWIGSKSLCLNLYNMGFEEMSDMRKKQGISKDCSFRHHSLRIF